MSPPVAISDKIMVALTDRKGIRKRNPESVEKSRKSEATSDKTTTTSKKKTATDAGESRDPKQIEERKGEASDAESYLQSVASSHKGEGNTSSGTESDDASTDDYGSSDDSSTGSQSLPAVSQAVSTKSVVTKASIFSSSSKGKEKVLRAKHENACRYLRVSVFSIYHISLALARECHECNTGNCSF